MKYVELIRGRDYLGYGIKAVKHDRLAVCDETADALARSGFFRILGDAPQEDVASKTDGKLAGCQQERSLDRMKTAELEEYAGAHGVDISACRTNAERAAAIRAAVSGDLNENGFCGGGKEEPEDTCESVQPDFGS